MKFAKLGIALQLFVMGVMAQRGNPINQSTDITDLTTDNFYDELAKKPHIVMFYVPG